MIKAVFFDLYGTLAGFTPSRHEIQSRACAEFGIEVTRQGVVKGYALADAYMADQNATAPVRGLDRDRRERFFAEYERLVLKGAGVEVDAGLAARVWRRLREVPSKLTPFPDAAPALEELRGMGLVLGMVSNMARPGAELARDLGLAAYLDVAVTSGEVGAEKPNPPIFLAALDRARVRADEAVHVGDQPRSDVEGARAVGISPVLLDRDGNHHGFDGCPRIESLREVRALVEARA